MDLDRNVFIYSGVDTNGRARDAVACLINKKHQETQYDININSVRSRIILHLRRKCSIIKEVVGMSSGKKASRESRNMER